MYLLGNTLNALEDFFTFLKMFVVWNFENFTNFYNINCIAATYKFIYVITAIIDQKLIYNFFSFIICSFKIYVCVIII